MRIAIIWWWAAWLMTAATLAERMRDGIDWSPASLPADTSIVIFEKNKELGTKIRISWWGRCNITTGYIKKKELEGKYIRGRDLLSHSMSQFGPRKMTQRCEEHGCPIYCQDDMRCFPVSNVGADVVAMFTRVMGNNVDVHYEEPVSTVVKRDDGVFVVTTSASEYLCDRVVITTGGDAYAHTWSSGDGYDLARSLWHTITACGPSLNSFLVSQEWVKWCSGISFADAQVMSASWESAGVYGPLLLTHFGISWPATFAYSAQVPLIPISEKQPHAILIRPYADRNRERWTQEITQTTLNHPKKQLLTLLCLHFPTRRCEAFCHAHNIDSTLYLGNITREQKQHLASLLGDWFPLTLISRRPGDEFVTAWGVDTKEIDPKTMESRICEGLYMAGEILNVDAVTGGFNFQACWATGRCVGNSIG